MQPIIFGQYMVIEKDDVFQGTRLIKGRGKNKTNSKERR